VYKINKTNDSYDLEFEHTLPTSFRSYSHAFKFNMKNPNKEMLFFNESQIMAFNFVEDSHRVEYSFQNLSAKAQKQLDFCVFDDQ